MNSKALKAFQTVARHGAGPAAIVTGLGVMALAYSGQFWLLGIPAGAEMAPAFFSLVAGIYAGGWVGEKSEELDFELGRRLYSMEGKGYRQEVGDNMDDVPDPVSYTEPAKANFPKRAPSP